MESVGKWAEQWTMGKVPEQSGKVPRAEWYKKGVEQEGARKWQS